MNAFSNSSIDIILIDYYSGKSTNEETIFVREWRSSSDSNNQYYQKLQKLWVNRIVL